MVPPKQVSRTIAKLCARIALGLFGLLSALILVCALVLGTSSGRELLWTWTQRPINSLIPGTIELGRIGELSPWGVELFDLEVKDPAGSIVLSLDRGQIKTDIAGLLRGVIALKSVRLDGVFVDAQTTEPRRGLLAAFVDPDAPPSPPSKKPPPDVRVHFVHVEKLRVIPPALGKSGPSEARVSRLKGRFALRAGRPLVEIETLDASASRDGEELVHLQASGHLPEGESPSDLALSVETPVGSATLLGTFSSPLEDDWMDQPIEVQLSIQGVRADRLAHLIQDPTLAGAFAGELTLDLVGHGTPRQPVVEGVLTTAGGKIEIQDLRLSDDDAHLKLALSGFDPSGLRSDLPPRSVDARIEANVGGLRKESRTFDLQLREARLDDIPLPRLDLGGRVDGAEVSPLTLSLRDGDSRIEADGRVGWDGSAEIALRLDLKDDLLHRLGKLEDIPSGGRITGHVQVARKESGHIAASGRLSADGLHAADVRVDQARAEVTLAGLPPQLSGNARLEVRGVSRQDDYIDELNLTLEGGPARYRVMVVGSGGQRTREEERRASVDLTAELVRKNESTSFTTQGSVGIGDRTVRLNVAPTQVFDSGAFATEGIDVELDGQQVHAVGSWGDGKRGGDLRVTTSTIDLERLATLARIKERLTGTLRVEAVARGSTARPFLRLDVAGERLGLRGKPPVDLNLDLTLDADEGVLDGQLLLQHQGQLEALLKTKASLGNSGALPSRLTGASGRAQLTLTRLDLGFVRAFLPPGSLPLSGHARGSYVFEGSQSEPTLRTETELTLTEGDARANVFHDLSYQEGRFETQLRVQDEQGVWAELESSLELPDPPPPLNAFGAALAAAPSAASWNVALDVHPREAPDVPLLSQFIPGKDLPPLEFTASVAATHESLAEPDIRAEVRAKQSRALSVEGCNVSGLEVRASFRHQQAENEVRVSASHGETDVLVAQASVRQPLAPFLLGQTPRPGPVDFLLTADELRVEDLPFVCGRLRGTLSANATGSDLLGKRPTLDLDLSAEQLRFEGGEGMDVEVASHLSEDGGRVEAQLRAGSEREGAGATLLARVPWRWSGGQFEMKRDLPLDTLLDLNHLPISTLVPPKGPISYASGHVDGRLQVTGTLERPQVNGSIELDDLAFTTTSIAQPLRGVEGRIRFAGRKVEIEHLEAHDRDGVLELNGQVDLSSMDHLEGTIHVTAEDFPLRQQGQVVAITNLKARAHSIVEPDRTVAELFLADVDTWLLNTSLRTGISLERHDEFIIDGDVPADLSADPTSGKVSEDPSPEPPASQEEPAASSSHPVHIKIDAEQRFWVKRSDFAVKLSTLLDTTIEGDEVRVQGDVVIDRGYLQLFGKVFDLERESVLKFIGSNPPNPVLDLEANHQTRNDSIVSVKITGRGDAPKLTFFVDGDEVDASIAVEELFGAGKGEGDDKDATAQAQGFVSGLTAGVLATAARRELGAAAPIVMIDPSDKAGEGRVRAGFELDTVIPEFLKPVVTGVYLEGIVARESQGGSTATTSFGTLLEIYFPKNFFAAGQYGPGTTWSVDFGWQL